MKCPLATRGLTEPALGIAFVVLAIAGFLGAGYAITALNKVSLNVDLSDPGKVNFPAAATSDDVANAAQVAKSLYGHSYDNEKEHFKTSPAVTGPEAEIWNYGEGDPAPQVPHPLNDLGTHW